MCLYVHAKVFDPKSVNDQELHSGFLWEVARFRPNSVTRFWLCSFPDFKRPLTIEHLKMKYFVLGLLLQASTLSLVSPTGLGRCLKISLWRPFTRSMASAQNCKGALKENINPAPRGSALECRISSSESALHTIKQTKPAKVRKILCFLVAPFMFCSMIFPRFALWAHHAFWVRGLIKFCKSCYTFFGLLCTPN